MRELAIRSCVCTVKFSCEEGIFTCLPNSSSKSFPHEYIGAE